MSVHIQSVDRQVVSCQIQTLKHLLERKISIAVTINVCNCAVSGLPDSLAITEDDGILSE